MPRTEPALTRHRLVRVHAQAWARWLSQQAELADVPLLARWADHGWPLIVRRALPDEPHGIPLALPLPASCTLRRVAVTLPRSAIDTVFSLPSLTTAIACAPASWHATLQRLSALAQQHEVTARAFGSLAWQSLTGLTYLSPRSDLDVLWTLPARAQLPGFLSALHAISVDAPMRLDGEIVRADGAGVNWRELQALAPELLVKSANTVALQTRAAFLAEAA